MKNEQNAKVEATKKEKSLTELLSNLELPKKGTSGRSENSLYKDREHLKNFDGGKSYRTKKRKEVKMKFFTYLELMKKETSKEGRKKLTDEILQYYKNTFTVNDFTVSSVSRENASSEAKEFFTKFFTILKVAMTEK